jgi:hypothetical protein
VSAGRGLWVGLLLLATLAAAGGCGEDDEGAAAPPTTSTSAQPAIELSIRYDDGAGRRESATLACSATLQRAGGFLDGKAPVSELCAKARSLETLLTTQPEKGRMCTQIYGGPQTARVTGTIDGKPVDRRFTRTNGCELADFSAAEALLRP